MINKKYKADVKLMVTVYFDNDGTSDLTDDAAEAVFDCGATGLHDLEILDITDIEVNDDQ